MSGENNWIFIYLFLFSSLGIGGKGAWGKDGMEDLRYIDQDVEYDEYVCDPPFLF